MFSRQSGNSTGSPKYTYRMPTSMFQLLHSTGNSSALHSRIKSITSECFHYFFLYPHESSPGGDRENLMQLECSSAMLYSRAPPRPISGLLHRGSPHSNKLEVNGFWAGPPSRLPAICPFPIRFGTRTPVPLTCHFLISHPGQHADHC